MPGAAPSASAIGAVPVGNDAGSDVAMGVAFGWLTQPADEIASTTTRKGVFTGV
jgi:hypothetical protein